MTTTDLQHPIAVGTLATREVLDALPSGSIVATYGNPWTKGDDGWWGELLRPGGMDDISMLYTPEQIAEIQHPDLVDFVAPPNAKWRNADWFEGVAYFVVYDSTEAWKQTGPFDSDTYKAAMQELGR